MGRSRLQIILSLSAAVVSWVIFQGCVVKEGSNDLQDEVAMVETPVGSAFVQREKNLAKRVVKEEKKVENKGANRIKRVGNKAERKGKKVVEKENKVANFVNKGERDMLAAGEEAKQASEKI